MYIVYAQSGPAHLGMRPAETIEEAIKKADQTAQELAERLSAPYDVVRQYMVIELVETQSKSA